MKGYLQTDPKYTSLLKTVWLWNDFPGRHDLGGSDTGIDLVALTHEGDYWAIQCKCFQDGTIVDKGDLVQISCDLKQEFQRRRSANDQDLPIAFGYRRRAIGD